MDAGSIEGPNSNDRKIYTTIYKTIALISIIFSTAMIPLYIISNIRDYSFYRFFLPYNATNMGMFSAISLFSSKSLVPASLWTRSYLVYPIVLFYIRQQSTESVKKNINLSFIVWAVGALIVSLAISSYSQILKYIYAIDFIVLIIILSLIIRKLSNPVFKGLVALNIITLIFRIMTAITPARNFITSTFIILTVIASFVINIIFSSRFRKYVTSLE